MLLSHGEEEDLLYTSSRPAALGGRRFANGAEYNTSVVTRLWALPWCPSKKRRWWDIWMLLPMLSGGVAICMSKGPGSKMSGQRG